MDRAVVFGLPLCFFIYMFCYVLLHINPEVIYSCNGFDLHGFVGALHSNDLTHANVEPSRLPDRESMILEITPAYFNEAANLPGGMTRLLTTLTIYACHYPIAGALLITGIAFLLFFLFNAYTKNWGCRAGVVHYLPGIFMLVIGGWYELYYLMYLLPVLGALGSSVLFRRWSDSTGFKGTIVFVFISGLIYWFFQWAAIVFLLLVIIDGLYSKWNKLPLYLVASAGVTILLTLAELFVVPLDRAIVLHTFVSPSHWPAAIILYFPAAAMLCCSVIHPLFQKKPLSGFPGGFRIMLLFLTIAGTTWWSTREPFNGKLRCIARTLHFCLNQQWDKVCREQSSGVFQDFPSASDPLQLYLIHTTDFALYKTGRLGSAMFAYPQNTTSPEPLLMLKNTLTYGYAKWAGAIDVYSELGLLNFAEKTAGELMENMGPYPFILYRRGLIQLAKRNYEAASVYLTRLSAMPFYRREARQLLAEMRDIAAIGSDPRIADMRRNMDTADYFIYQTGEETILRNLLGRNPRNRMAFEYLMAYYLQTGNTQGVASEVKRAGAFGYAHNSLPKHWQEALCISIAEDSVLAANPPDIGISPEIFNLFDSFNRRYTPDENNFAPAAAKLEPEFGSSYFFFYSFAYSPGGRR